MNSIQFISNKNQVNTTSINKANSKMDIHLLLNAAEEVKRNQQYPPLPPPTVLLPRTIIEQPQSSQYYLQKSSQDGSDKTEAELEAIEFLSKLNNIKANINSAFQGLKQQQQQQQQLPYGSLGLKNYKNIKEINTLGQELINVCKETRQSMSSQIHKIYDNSNCRPPLSPHITTLNSMTLPYTINNNNNHYNHNHHICKSYNHPKQVFKKKLEHIHSVNIVTPSQVKFNSQNTIVTPPMNTPTSFLSSNNQSPKMVTKKNSNTTTPIIRKNHEMDGKPCTHCLSIEKTPEWRSGPYGNEQKICNACGLFYRKLKQKFGLNDANIIMKYRKLKCATNRRVPQMFDVPTEWIMENFKKVSNENNGNSKSEPITPQDTVMNTQLISPVVTPLVKTSLSSTTTASHLTT